MQNPTQPSFSKFWSATEKLSGIFYIRGKFSTNIDWFSENWNICSSFVLIQKKQKIKTAD